MLARYEGLNALVDVHKEHLNLLRTMHDVGLTWAEKFLQEDGSLIFRLGYHTVCKILTRKVTLLFIYFWQTVKIVLDS